MNSKYYFLLDIDAFFASVEQARDPQLKGRPVIVGNGVIASCSYEARPFGLKAGMSIRTAERLCPEGVYLDGDQTAYSAVSARIEDICYTCAPKVERVSIDEFFLDMSGFQRLHPDLLRRAYDLAGEIEADSGVPVSIGGGENRLIAKMAAGFGKPRGITCVYPGYGAAFIAPMEISKLHGVGHRRKKLFERMNIKTIGDLRRLPQRSLRTMFGRNGEYLADACQGIEAGLPRYGGIPSTINRETTFHADSSDRQYISGMLWYLVERAARAMRGHGLECRCIEVRLRYSDFKSAHRSISMTAYSCRDAELFRTAEMLFESQYTRRVKLRQVGITLSRFRPAARETQMLLFEPEPPPYYLYEQIDTIRTKYGHAALTGGRSIELMNSLERSHDRGFVLRTPSLTQ